MKEQPLISIIIPVYNTEQYLKKCLDSVANQTCRNLQIICVNDGSSDRSLTILREYEENDPRIVIVNKANEGVSKARNDGLAFANGQYIMFVDADDWIDPETCEKAYSAMITYGADVVMWSYISEGSGSGSRKVIFPENRIFKQEEVLDTLHRRLIGLVDDELIHPELADSLSPVWGKLYKKQVIVQSNARFIDLSEIGTYEDGMFNLVVFQYVKEAVYLNQYFYHYRRDNTSSVTTGYRSHLMEQWCNLFQKMREYIEEEQLSDRYVKALNNRIALSILGLGLNIMSADSGHFRKIALIGEILKNGQYRQAYKELDFQYFPIHWKVFYWCAKHQVSAGVYAMLTIIWSIINHERGRSHG